MLYFKAEEHEKHVNEISRLLNNQAILAAQPTCCDEVNKLELAIEKAELVRLEQYVKQAKEFNIEATGHNKTLINLTKMMKLVIQLRKVSYENDSIIVTYLEKNIPHNLDIPRIPKMTH